MCRKLPFTPMHQVNTIGTALLRANSTSQFHPVTGHLSTTWRLKSVAKFGGDTHFQHTLQSFEARKTRQLRHKLTLSGRLRSRTSDIASTTARQFTEYFVGFKLTSSTSVHRAPQITLALITLMLTVALSHYLIGEGYDDSLDDVGRNVLQFLMRFITLSLLVTLPELALNSYMCVLNSQNSVCLTWVP